MITGIAHINLTVPEGTLDQAEAFYSGVLGFTRVPVPELQKGTLAWYESIVCFKYHIIILTKSSRFDITPRGQQIHIAFGPPSEKSSRHPCFRVESPEALLKLQTKVYDYFTGAEEKGKPVEADQPGTDSGELP